MFPPFRSSLKVNVTATFTQFPFFDFWAYFNCKIIFSIFSMTPPTFAPYRCTKIVSRLFETLVRNDLVNWFDILQRLEKDSGTRKFSSWFGTRRREVVQDCWNVAHCQWSRCILFTWELHWEIRSAFHSASFGTFRDSGVSHQQHFEEAVVFRVSVTSDVLVRVLIIWLFFSCRDLIDLGGVASAFSVCRAPIRSSLGFVALAFTRTEALHLYKNQLHFLITFSVEI